jgi:Holliday junction DNA helicase RuvA
MRRMRWRSQSVTPTGGSASVLWKEPAPAAAEGAQVYAFIEGTLQERSSVVVVDVQGVGYELNVGERQRLSLPAPGERVRLYTHLVVREDEMTLYGFLSLDEREVFRALLSVNGVGPKVALSVLGSEQSDEVLRGIRRGDPKPLLSVKGIGKKIAERVVLELEDKAAAWAVVSAGDSRAASAAAGISGPAAEAVLALQSLGVGPDRAAAAVAAVLTEGPAVSVEVLLRAALRQLHPEQKA